MNPIINQFFKGIAKIFAIHRGQLDFKDVESTDSCNLASDWLAIENDIKKSMDSLDKTFGRNPK